MNIDLVYLLKRGLLNQSKQFVNNYGNWTNSRVVKYVILPVIIAIHSCLFCKIFGNLRPDFIYCMFLGPTDIIFPDLK